MWFASPVRKSSGLLRRNDKFEGGGRKQDFLIPIILLFVLSFNYSQVSLVEMTILVVDWATKKALRTLRSLFAAFAVK